MSMPWTAPVTRFASRAAVPGRIIGRPAKSATLGQDPRRVSADWIDMRTGRAGKVLLLLAWPALAACAGPTIASARPPAPASGAPAAKKSYYLRARPSVGQRIAYEQSMDTTLRISAAAAG